MTPPPASSESRLQGGRVDAVTFTRERWLDAEWARQHGRGLGHFLNETAGTDTPTRSACAALLECLGILDIPHDTAGTEVRFQIQCPTLDAPLDVLSSPHGFHGRGLELTASWQICGARPEPYCLQHLCTRFNRELGIMRVYPDLSRRSIGVPCIVLGCLMDPEVTCTHPTFERFLRTLTGEAIRLEYMLEAWALGRA